MLVGLLQFLDRDLGVSRVERDISREVGIELHLLGIVGIVEGGFGGGHMLLGIVGIAALGSNASLSTLPAEHPQMLVSVRQVRLVDDGGVSQLADRKRGGL